MSNARVVHVITGLGDGGAEGALVRLVLAQRPNAPEPVVISLTDQGRYAEVLRHAGVEVITLNMRRGQPSLRALGTLRSEVRRVRPVAVQSWMYHADLAAVVACRGLVRKTTRLYWGIRCSDMDASRYGLGLKLTRGMCAWLSGKPDAVVANSFAGKHVHLQLGYQPRRFVVIPNGIDGARFQPSSRIRQEVSNELGIAAGERVALTVARNDPMKGYGTLLAAARALPDIRFVLVGTGTQELRGLDNIIALGQRDDVERIATAADFIVSSSLFGEGFSNAIGEGMAAGLCPVVSDVGDARIIVGDSGYVVTPGSTEALVRALQTAAVSADLASLQQRARQRIVETYTVERMVQAFDALHLRAEYPAEAEQCAAS